MAPDLPTHNNTRALSAQLLSPLIEGRSSLSQQLAALHTKLSPRDRAFVAELCFGSMRFYPELTGLIAQLLTKPLKPKDSDLQALLIIGAYQLRYLRVPDHAAIGETVSATKTLGKPWARGLVNGVLRNLQRRGPQLEAALTPAARQNHPSWLLDKLHRQWPGDWQAIVAANNQAPPMTIRVNRLQHSRSGYLEQLKTAGITANACELSDDGIQLQQAVDVHQLPGFDSGSCSVQDESSQLVAGLLDRRTIESQHTRRRILDSCCAPGGKTAHLLECYADTDLDAVDVDQRRLLRVEQNLARLGLSANVLCGDSRQPRNWWDQRPYDAILLDAPCSASGVIRRHPDIKVLRKENELKTLAREQRELLKALWPCLKPGGHLLYTTCSVFAEENDDVVGAFLDSTADAHLDTITADWGLPRRYGRQLLPTVDAHDGFYYARMYKTP